MNDLVILGAGGVGRQVAQIVLDINSGVATWNVIGYLDDDTSKANKSVAGLPVIGNSRWLSSHTDVYVAVAIGAPSARFEAYQKLEQIEGCRIVTLVHPTVLLGQRVEIGTGSIIYPNTVLDPDTRLGRGTIVNKACTIGHDSTLGDFVTLAPGVNIGGAVQIGTACYFGINSATIQSVSVGKGSIVGAGAVVIEDLPDGVTAVGVPAHILKRRKANV